MKEKTSSDHELVNLLLLRWQYPPKLSNDSTKSVSKCQQSFNEMPILKPSRNCKGLQITQTLWKKKNDVEGHALHYFRTTKSDSNKTMVLSSEVLINWIELSPEVNLSIYSQLFSNITTKSTQWRKNSFQEIILGQLDFYMQKNELETLLHI